MFWASPPPEIEFPDKDSEEIDVANLPSLYRSIFETGRKHDLPDTTIERIIAMFAYDLDLTKKINAGDSVELLFFPSRMRRATKNCSMLA